MLLTSFYLIFVLQDYNEYFRDLNVSNKKKMNGYINQCKETVFSWIQYIQICLGLNAKEMHWWSIPKCLHEKNLPQGSVVLSNLKQYALSDKKPTTTKNKGKPAYFTPGPKWILTHFVIRLQKNATWQNVRKAI